MVISYAIGEPTRSAIINAARQLGELWGTPDVVTLHAAKPDTGNHWELAEVITHLTDDHSYRLTDEQVYSEEGVDSDFEATFESAASAVSSVGGVAREFEAAEPWLAVVDIQTEPRLVWRTTTVTPIDYNRFEEWSTDHD